MHKYNWAVRAYCDWTEERFRTFNYDYSIYTADLNKLESLTKGDLQHALCRFVPEVTKSQGDGPYPVCTLYQLVVAIQKYLAIS